MGMAFFSCMEERIFKERKVIVHKYSFTFPFIYDIIIS